MEEAHIIHDSDSEEEENETSIWSRNGEYKRFTHLENPAREIILQCLLSDKKHFPHEAVKTFGETLRKTLKVTYLPSTKVFIWKNVIRWTWVMKQSLNGTFDTDHAERLNFYLTDILAQYVNYKCETSFTKDDMEVENVANEIYTTLWIILHPQIFYIVMTLLKVDVEDNYFKILDPIFKKCLSNKDLSKHTDLIKYLGLILCFRHYKKLFKTKEEKEEINKIAVGKSLKQLKAENAVTSLESKSEGILSRSVPKIDEYNQCFASISGLVKFATGKKNIGTRILLINESLDLDEAITKYFDQYQLHLNRNTEYSSWLKSGFFNQDRLTLGDDQQSTTIIDLTQSDSKNVSLNKLSTSSISSTSNGAANNLKQPNRDILIDKKKNDKNFNLRDSSCKLNINSQNNLNNNQTDKNSQPNSDNIHPNSSIINSSSNNHCLLSVEVSINLQGDVGVIRSNKNGSSFEISHVGNTYNCHPCNPNNCHECTNQYIDNSQNYAQYMGSNQGYPPHTYSNCDNQNNSLDNSTNFINKNNNSIVSQYSGYEVVELINSDDENSALCSRESLSLISNKISTPTTFNPTLQSSSNLDHTRNLQKDKDNKNESISELSNSQNDLSNVSRNETAKLTTKISNFVTKPTNEKDDENIRQPSSKKSNLSQKNTDSFTTNDLSQSIESNDCILEGPESEQSSTIHRLGYDLDRVTSMNKESSKKTHLKNSFEQNIPFKSSLISDSSNKTDENVVSTTKPKEVENIESTNLEADWYCTKYSNMNDDCSKPYPYGKSSGQANVLNTQDIFTSIGDSNFQSGKPFQPQEATTSDIVEVDVLAKKKDRINSLEDNTTKNCKEISKKFKMSSKYSNTYYRTATSIDKSLNQTKYEAFKRFTVEKSIVTDENIGNKNAQENSLVKTTEDKSNEQNLLKQPRATGNHDLKNDNKRNEENNSLQLQSNFSTKFIEPKQYSVIKESRKSKSINKTPLDDINSIVDDMTMVATSEEKSCNSPRDSIESIQKQKNTDLVKAKLDKSDGDHKIGRNISVQEDSNKKLLEGINNTANDTVMIEIFKENLCNSLPASTESRQKEKDIEFVKEKLDKSDGDHETKSNNSVKQNNKKSLEGLNNIADNIAMVETFKENFCNSLPALTESRQTRKDIDIVKEKLDKSDDDHNNSVQQNNNKTSLENINNAANDTGMVKAFEESPCKSFPASTEFRQKGKDIGLVKEKLDKFDGDRETKSDNSVQQDSNKKPLGGINNTTNDTAMIEISAENACNSHPASTESRQKEKDIDFVKEKLDKSNDDHKTKSNNSVQQNNNKKSLENIKNAANDTGMVKSFGENPCKSLPASTESRQKGKDIGLVKEKLDKSAGDHETNSDNSKQQDSNKKPLGGINNTANDTAMIEISKENACNSLPASSKESKQKEKDIDFVKEKLDKSDDDHKTKSNNSVQQNNNKKSLENINNAANDTGMVKSFDENPCKSLPASTESRQKGKDIGLVKEKLDKSAGDHETNSDNSKQQDSNKKPLGDINNTANDTAMIEISAENACNSLPASTESRQKEKDIGLVKETLDKSAGDHETNSDNSVQQDSNKKPLGDINNTANDTAMIEISGENACNSLPASTESRQKEKDIELVKETLDKSAGNHETNSDNSKQQDSNKKPLGDINNTVNDTAMIEISGENACNSLPASTESRQKEKDIELVKETLDKSAGDHETNSDNSKQQDSNKKPLGDINNTVNDTAMIEISGENACNSLPASKASRQKEKIIELVKEKLDKSDGDRETKSDNSVQQDSNKKPLGGINNTANDTTMIEISEENARNSVPASSKESKQKEKDIELVKEKLDKSAGDHETNSDNSKQQDSNKKSLGDINNTVNDTAMIEISEENARNSLPASTESRQKEKDIDFVKEKLDKSDDDHKTKSNNSVQQNNNKTSLENINNAANDTGMVKSFEENPCKSLSTSTESRQKEKDIDFVKEKLDKSDGDRETKSDNLVQQDSNHKPLGDINNIANDTAMVETFEENYCNPLRASTEPRQKQKGIGINKNSSKSNNSVKQNNKRKSMEDINNTKNSTAIVETIEESFWNSLPVSAGSSQQQKGTDFVKEKLDKSVDDHETESNISLQQESKTEKSRYRNKGKYQKVKSITSRNNNNLNTNVDMIRDTKIVNQDNAYPAQNEISCANQIVTSLVDAKECGKEISIQKDINDKVADSKRRIFPQQTKFSDTRKEIRTEEQKKAKIEEQTETSKSTIKETRNKTFEKTKETNKNVTAERKIVNKKTLKNNIIEEKIINKKTKESSKNSIKELKGSNAIITEKEKESRKNTIEETKESRKSLRQQKQKATIDIIEEKNKACTDGATKIEDIPNLTDCKSENLIIKTNFDKEIVKNTKAVRLQLHKSNSSSEKSDLISKQENTIDYKNVSENVADKKGSFIEDSDESKEKCVIDEHSTTNDDNICPDTQDGKMFGKKNSVKSNMADKTNEDKDFNPKSCCKVPSELSANFNNSNKHDEFDSNNTTPDTQTDIYDGHKKEFINWNSKKLSFKSRIFNEKTRDNNKKTLSNVNNLTKTHSTDEKQVLMKDAPYNLKEPSDINSSVEYPTILKDDICHGIDVEPISSNTNTIKVNQTLTTKASKKMYSEIIVKNKDNKQLSHAENSSFQRGKDVLPNQNDEIEFVKAYINTEYKKESPYRRAKSVRFALTTTEENFERCNENDKESYNKETTEKFQQNTEKPKLTSLKKVLKEKGSLELARNDSNEPIAEKIIGSTVKKVLSKANQECSKELKLTNNQIIQSNKMNELEKSNSNKVNKKQSNVSSINEHNSTDDETTTNAFLAKIDAVLNEEQEKDELKQPSEINEEVNQVSYLKDLGLTEIEQTKGRKKNVKTTKKDDCISEVLTQNHFDIDSNKISALDLLASVADREVSAQSKLSEINTFTNTRRLSKRKINSNQSSQRITRNNLTPQEKKSMEFFVDLAKYIDQPVRKKKLKENVEKASKSGVEDSLSSKKSKNECENINEDLTVETQSTEDSTTKEKTDLLPTSNKPNAKIGNLVAKIPKVTDNESKIELNNQEKKDGSLKLIFKNFNSNNAIIVNSTDLSRLEKKEETINSTETNQSNKRGKKLSEKKSPLEIEEKELEIQTAAHEDETEEYDNEENIKINEDLSDNEKEGKKSGKPIRLRFNNISKKGRNKQRQQQKTISSKKSPAKCLKKSEKLNEKITIDQNISKISPKTDVTKEVIIESNEEIAKAKNLKCVKKLQFDDFSDKKELVNKVEIETAFESNSNSTRIRNNSQSLMIDEKLKPIDDSTKSPPNYTVSSNKEQQPSKPVNVQQKISNEKTPICCNTTPQNLKLDEAKIVKLQSEIPITFSPPNAIVQPPKKRRNSFFTESQYDSVQSTINKVNISDMPQTPCLSLIPYEGGLSQVKTKIKKKSINAIVCELAAKRHNEENVPCSNKRFQSESETKIETEKGDLLVEFDSQGNFQPFMQITSINQATENIKPKPNDLENKISTENYTKHHVLKRRRIQSINFDVQQNKQETSSIEEVTNTKEFKTDRTNQEVLSNSDNVVLMSTACNKGAPDSTIYTTILDNGTSVTSNLEEVSKPDLFSEPLDMSLNSSANSILHESPLVFNSENYTITTELENKNSECEQLKKTLNNDNELVLQNDVLETDSHKGHPASNFKELTNSDVVPESNVSNQISNLITENNSKIYDDTIKLKVVSLELQKSSVVEFDCEPLPFTISTNEKSDNNQASGDNINNLQGEPAEICKHQTISDDFDDTLIKLGLTTVESSTKNQLMLQEKVNTITAKVNTDSKEEAGDSGNFIINSEVVTADATCKQQETCKIFHPNEDIPTPKYTDAAKPDRTITNNLQTEFNSSETLLESTHYFENVLIMPSANNSDTNINLSPSSEVTSNLINDNNDAAGIEISLDRIEDSSSICNDPNIDLISSTVEVETEQSNDFNLDEATASAIVDKIVPEKINDLPKADDHQLISSQLLTFSQNMPEHLLSGDDAENYIFDNLSIADSSPKLHLDDKMNSDQNSLDEPKVDKCAVSLTCNEDLEEPQSKIIKPNLKLDDYLNNSVSSTNECKENSNIVSTSIINTQYDPDAQINDFDFLSIFDDHKYFETGLLGINGMSDVGINENHEWSDQINKLQINRGDALISGQCCDYIYPDNKNGAAPITTAESPESRSKQNSLLNDFISDEFLNDYNSRLSFDNFIGKEEIVLSTPLSQNIVNKAIPCPDNSLHENDNKVDNFLMLEKDLIEPSTSKATYTTTPEQEPTPIKTTLEFKKPLVPPEKTKIHLQTETHEPPVQISTQQYNTPSNVHKRESFTPKYFHMPDLEDPIDIVTPISPSLKPATSTVKRKGSNISGPLPVKKFYIKDSTYKKPIFTTPQRAIARKSQLGYTNEKSQIVSYEETTFVRNKNQSVVKVVHLPQRTNP